MSSPHSHTVCLVCRRRSSSCSLEHSLTGSDTTLVSLLRANAHQEIIRALANQYALGVPTLKSALARGLRVLAGAIADVVGPSYGPMRTHTPELRAEAKVALDYLFEVGHSDEVPM